MLQSFDVLVVDLKMEEMDGIVFLQEALKIWPWVGVVIVSGFITDEALSEAGKLKVIGLTGAKRPATPALAQYPTIAESGVPNYDENTWYGLFAPASLPPALLQKINADVLKVLRAPEINARFGPEGQTIVGNTPDEFKENVRAEVAKWRTMLKELGLQQL